MVGLCQKGNLKSYRLVDVKKKSQFLTKTIFINRVEFGRWCYGCCSLRNPFFVLVLFYCYF